MLFKGINTHILVYTMLRTIGQDMTVRRAVLRKAEGNIGLHMLKYTPVLWYKKKTFLFAINMNYITINSDKGDLISFSLMMISVSLGVIEIMECDGAPCLYWSTHKWPNLQCLCLLNIQVGDPEEIPVVCRG